jgi:N-acetyl-1-D-myo-inositol-2-amino-2-deoxy-alpha-D-glucopyranoside deacetylase
VAAVAERWRVPKFYWTVVSGNAFRRGIAELESADVLPDWIWPEDDSTFTVGEDQITTVIDAPEHRAAKVAAIAAHATQVTLGPTGRAFTLSNNIVLPVLTEEHYVLVAGELGSNSGREDDLLAGLDL